MNRKNSMIKKKKGEIKRIVVLLLIFGCFCGLSCAVENRAKNYSSANQYASSDVTYADGTTKHTESNNFGLVGKGDQVMVHVRLPKDQQKPNQVLCFDIYHSVVKIWFRDILLASGGEDTAAKNGFVGYEEYAVNIPDEAWGDELKIELIPTENQAFTRIEYLQVYPAEQTYHFFFNIEPIRFLTALPMLVMAIFFLLLVFFMPQEKQLKNRGICFATCLLILAIYIVIKSEIPYMVFPDSGLWPFLEFCTAFVVSYPLLCYVLLSLPKGRRKNICMTVFMIEMVHFVIMTILHFTNIVHYSVTLHFASVLTALNAVIILVYSIKTHEEDKLSWRLRNDTFVLAALCGLVDVSINIFLNQLGISIPSVLHFGLMSMIIGMMLSYVLELAESQTTVVENQLKSQRLEQYLNEIPAGICVIDLAKDGQIIQANESFYELRGYSKQDLENQKELSFYDRVVEHDRSWLRQTVNKLLQEEKSPMIEATIRHKDGRELNMLAKSYVNRKAMTATINVIDITERKRAENELKISEERYRLALTQSGKVFFFFDVPTRTMHLSKDLAQAFGLPMDVDNMPDNLIAEGLVEPRSVETYREFYRRIYRGDACGDAIISCHMRQAPKVELWYRIAFTTVFNEKKKPQSSIITYEDINEQHQNEISSAWRPQNLLSVPEVEWVMAEYNLSRNVLLKQIGGLFPEVPAERPEYDEISEFVCRYFIYEEDVERFRIFFDRQRILADFESGIGEFSIEYRSVQNGTVPRWTRTTIQLIRDPYSDEVLAQLLFQDINAEKTGQLEMQHNMEALKEELENNRIRIMINQMQPHFLYNALSAIQTIVKTDPDYAYQLIYDFTVHLRASIKALSSEQPIPFMDELKNVKAYLNIEQMRFGKKLHIKYDIECKDFKVIPLSIQPLAENATRHGIYPKGDEGGTVTLRTYETMTDYVVEVEDDGIGFNVEEIMNNQSDSIGLKNMVFRMKSLMNANVTITSHINVGTKVTVTIPIEGEM